jgi:endogenous inhibitor of DNA gyrase (YacG/DUF329 family)
MPSGKQHESQGRVPGPAVTCPTCRRVTPWFGNPCRPFCSERCREIDLGRWAAEEYRIPAREDPGVATPDDE